MHTSHTPHVRRSRSALAGVALLVACLTGIGLSSRTNAADRPPAPDTRTTSGTDGPRVDDLLISEIRTSPSDRGARNDDPHRSETADGGISLDLELVERVRPTDAAPTPAPLTEVPPSSPSAPGQWSTNDFGCSTDCIIHALIDPMSGFPDVGFDIETTVAVSTSIWFTTEPIPWADGVPVPGQWPTATSPAFQSEWQTTTTNLQWDTTYDVAVLVIDHQNNVQWATTQYTTIASPRPDDLTAPGSPCYFQCITDGFIYELDTHDAVDLVVLTNGASSIDVAVSPDEPWWVGEQPQLAHDQPFVVSQNSGDALRGTVSELLPDTVYHVVVEATDAEGFTAHAVGSFRSQPAPPPPDEVMVVFNHIEVIGDGDPGSANKGEIQAVLGFLDGSFVDFVTEEDIGGKVGSDSAFDLPSDSFTTTIVQPGEQLPTIAVNVVERDGSPCQPGASYAYKLFAEPVGQMNWCGSAAYHTNVALLEDVDVDWIATLPECDEFGYVDWRHDHRCVEIASDSVGDQYVSFSAVISFDVVS